MSKALDFRRKSSSSEQTRFSKIKKEPQYDLKEPVSEPSKEPVNEPSKEPLKPKKVSIKK